MHNVKWTVPTKGKLLIEIDISDKALKDATPSATGKTNLVASTGSAQVVFESGRGHATRSRTC